MSDAAPRSLTQRIAGQGAVLFAGFGLAQALSFARNAILAHWLSMGDFGVAAAILLLLQTIETLSDIGADRLIVQAADGDEERFVANAHLVLLARGVLTFLVILLAAEPMARFFGASGAAWAFAAAGVAPLIKGLLHLDARRAQRRLDNRPQMLIEAVPQAIALASIPLVLSIDPGYGAVVWIAMLQATAAVATSHAIAERRYRLALDRTYLRRMLAFGWPIWASAFPLVAVYQGDRMAVGHLAGLEALAGFTAAFMVTMVPGLMAAKVANALMLPLLSREVSRHREFSRRFALMLEFTVLAAAIYLIVFVILGDELLALAFGAKYAGLGTVVSLLALMWAMRMVQATMGVALMAHAITRPFLIAGIVRSSGVVFAIAALLGGHGLTGAAAAGAFAELLSLVYVAWRLDRLRGEAGEACNLGRRALVTASSLILFGVTALTAARYGSDLALSAKAALAVLLAVGCAGCGVAMLPSLRGLLRNGHAVAAADATHPAANPG